MNRPNINVTPLIDVLLVLLIIFMVVSPLRPSAFKTKLPSETRSTCEPNPTSLVVEIAEDGSLQLNKGPLKDPDELNQKLASIFEQRKENVVTKDHPLNDPDFPLPDEIERTVFIKAPRSIDYGTVALAIDAVKSAGAVPISLQLDDLK
jgi:biopolymer transport protein ExbD